MIPAVVFSLALAACPARAQSGCDDTPENPTVVLGALSGAMFAASGARSYLRAKRAKKSS